MKKIYFSILFLFTIVMTRAHNSQISTVSLVQNEEQIWNLYISSSFDSFKYQLISKYPDIDIDNLSAEKYQKLLLKYLQENIILTANGEKMANLHNGIIKLGHQTDLIYEVNGLPEKLTSLYLKLDGFENDSKHNSIFKIVTPQLKSKNFILKKDNEFQLSLEKANEEFQLVPKEDNTSLFLPIMGLTVLVLTTILAISNLFKNPEEIRLKQV